MQSVGLSTGTPYKFKYPGSSFFRALNAPFAPTPFLPDEPPARLPRLGNPAAPRGMEPLFIPVFKSTGDWAWLNREPFYEIRDLTTIHDSRVHKTTIRACRAGDRTLAYLNKSWKINPRRPGITRELWLYKFALKELMGECVPRLIAVRISPASFNLGFEIPHQTFLMEASADMPEVLKRRVFRSLETLHAKGVCHNDLSLDNILIGGDGNIYFCNFHHATFIRPQPSVSLEKAKEVDFVLEKRRLEFQLDYENARTKEKDRLATAIDRERINRFELGKQKLNPSYKPKLLMQDPTPPFSWPSCEAWVTDLDREPRRFIMPGQTEDDFDWELKRFYNILSRMEDLDRAAGSTHPAANTPVEIGPSTDEAMVGSDDEDMEVDSILASNERHRPLKRKRSAEMEGSDSSQPSASKRLKRAFEFTSGASGSQSSRRFKNEELRQGVKLVSSYEIEGSVQENNVVSHWPIVVVRDFQKKPPPEVDGALKALVNKYSAQFKEERDREREKDKEVQARERAAQQTSRSSWISGWNPLRYLWGSQGDKGGQGNEGRSHGSTSTSLPGGANPLRRHETLFIP